MPTVSPTASPTVSATVIISDSVQIDADADKDSVLVSKDQKLKLEIPKGAVQGQTRISQTHWPAMAIDDGRYRFLRVFELKGRASNGDKVEAFQRALTLTYTYAGDGLSDSAHLYFFSYNRQTAHWDAVPAQRDTQQKTVTARINHFSLWSIGQYSRVASQ